MISVLQNCFGCVTVERGGSHYTWKSEATNVNVYQHVVIEKICYDNESPVVESKDGRSQSEATTTKKLYVRVYDNAVNTFMCEEVLKMINSRGFTYGWQSNWDMGFGHWNVVFGGYQKLHRGNVEHEIPQIALDIWRIIQPAFMPDTPVLIRCYANAHTYGVEGYPHTDSKEETDVTGILYLNKSWKREWAGETAFFEGEDISYSVIPKLGRLVVFRSTLWHTARSLSRICPHDRVVIVFKARTNSTEFLPQNTVSTKGGDSAKLVTIKAQLVNDGTAISSTSTQMTSEVSHQKLLNKWSCHELVCICVCARVRVRVFVCLYIQYMCVCLHKNVVPLLKFLPTQSTDFSSGY